MLSSSPANEKIALIAKGDDPVRFLKIWDEFLEKDGTIAETIMPDRLHLSETGYRIWADSMMPALREMLKP